MDARIPKYLTVGEAAKILRVSSITLRRWIKSGRLEAIQAGRKYLIPSGVFQAFQEAGRVQAQVQPCALSGSES